MKTNNEDIPLMPNRRNKEQSIAVAAVVILLPGLFVFLAYWNEGDLRTAYWVAAGVSALLLLRLGWSGITNFFGRPNAILKSRTLINFEGVEIPAEVVKEIVIVLDGKERLIALRLTRGAARLYPELIEQLDDECVYWFTMKLALTLPYDGLSLPGERVVEILREKYGFPLREQEIAIKAENGGLD